MLTVVRKNKRFANRKLEVFDGDKKIAIVEPCWGWFTWWYVQTNTSIPRHVFMEQYYKEFRVKVMENLYWLLGHGCDKKTWVETVEHWNSGKGVSGISADTKSMFHNIHELGIAIDSFNDGYYKED